MPLTRSEDGTSQQRFSRLHWKTKHTWTTNVWSSSILNFRYRSMKTILHKCFRGHSFVTNPRIQPVTIQQECAHISLSTTTSKNTNPQLTRSFLSDKSMRTFYFTKLSETLKLPEKSKFRVPHHKECGYNIPWHKCPCTVLSCHHK